MTNQSITRSQPNGHIVPQGNGKSPVQLTEACMQQMAGVTMTIIEVRDSLYTDVETFVNKPGRSAPNQQSLEGFAALLTNNFDRAAVTVQAQAFTAIVANKPPEVVTRVVTVPQKGLLPRLFGR
jgi:hypothetical protein